MAKFLIRSLSATTAVLASVAIASTVHAQDTPPTSNSAYIPTAVNEIFFGNTGPYNVNRSLGGELGTMFGVGGFPENDITQDGFDVFEAYNYLLFQQSQTDPTIRVPDLANPYQTSVQFLPTGSSAGMVSGSEFIFE
jgi:hypothetical protein